MRQFECTNCGYDMTGIEHLTNTMNSTFYPGVDNTFMDVVGLYNSQFNNSVRCPNCGQVGRWVKH